MEQLPVPAEWAGCSWSCLPVLSYPKCIFQQEGSEGGLQAAGDGGFKGEQQGAEEILLAGLGA